jgi:hypothetical protein
LILLAERGFASEAKAICRNILEAKFKLGFLVEKPKAAEMMLAKHEAERIKRLEKYKAKELPVQRTRSIKIGTNGSQKVGHDKRI